MIEQQRLSDKGYSLSVNVRYNPTSDGTCSIIHELYDLRGFGNQNKEPVASVEIRISKKSSIVDELYGEKSLHIGIISPFTIQNDNFYSNEKKLELVTLLLADLPSYDQKLKRLSPDLYDFKEKDVISFIFSREAFSHMPHMNCLSRLTMPFEEDLYLDLPELSRHVSRILGLKQDLKPTIKKKYKIHLEDEIFYLVGCDTSTQGHLLVVEFEYQDGFEHGSECVINRVSSFAVPEEDCLQCFLTAFGVLERQEKRTVTLKLSDMFIEGVKAVEESIWQKQLLRSDLLIPKVDDRSSFEIEA